MTSKEFKEADRVRQIAREKIGVCLHEITASLVDGYVSPKQAVVVTAAIGKELGFRFAEALAVNVMFLTRRTPEGEHRQEFLKVCHKIEVELVGIQERCMLDAMAELEKRGEQ